MTEADGSKVAAFEDPRVVISLDFELRWGVHDVYRLDFGACRGNIERMHYAVPALLKLFEQHEIRATWAAVGAIGCESWDDYFRRAPQAPKYVDPSFAINPHYADLDPAGALHFAPDLMKSIAVSMGQKLGTHTFSHLYLREKGVTAADVASDLAAAADLYRDRFGTLPRSLVFPRNQCAFLDVIRASTVRIWRGNQKRWYYEREESERHGIIPRALKLVDELNPLSRRAATLEGGMTRASMFLRLSLPAPLWDLHVQRIKNELRSLRSGDIFHVWFHPENLGEDMTYRLVRVEQVLSLIAEKRVRGKVHSCAMEDLIMESAIAAAG